MSNFNCEHCNTAIIDSPYGGYATECGHYPIIKLTKAEKQKQYNKDYYKRKKCMRTITTQSGKYKLTRKDDSHMTLFLSANQAKLMYGIFGRLDFESIELIEKMHPADTRKQQQLFQNM